MIPHATGDSGARPSGAPARPRGGGGVLAPLEPAAGPRLWARQVGVLARIELGRILTRRAALAGWGLALVPVLLVAARVAAVRTGLAEPASAVDNERVYAVLFQTLILRLCLFFGCLATCVNAFRGELHDRTLHYLLLAPIRRPVLALGKLAGGVAGAALGFGAATLATRVLLPMSATPLDSWRLAAGEGWLGVTAAYVAVALLACAAYGAVFTVIGLLPVNPILPAIGLLAWESVNVFLPAGLKRVGIVHHLAALLPVPLDVGPVAIVAPPPSAPMALAALVLHVGLCAAAAARLARRLEAGYGVD